MYSWRGKFRPQAIQGGEQRPVVGGVEAAFRENHDIESAQLLLMVPETFPDQALHAVTLGSSPERLLADGQTESWVAQGTVAIQQCEVLIGRAPRLREDPRKLTRIQ